MTDRLPKAELHKQFIKALGPALATASTDTAGELVVRLRPPLPQRIRVYLYNATNPPGGRSTPEHKIQLGLTGQRRDERRDLDWSGVDFVLLCGYVDERDVFVFWDASMHINFPHSKNLQVKTANVQTAAASGVRVRQDRRLQTGMEVVICAPVQLVVKAIAERASSGEVGSRGTGSPVTLWVPIIRSWALTRGYALHPGTRNRYEIRCTRTQDRPPSRQVNDHGRVSGTRDQSLCPEQLASRRPQGVNLLQSRHPK